MEIPYFDVLPLHPPSMPLETFSSYILRLSEANDLRTPEEIGLLFFTGTTISPEKLKFLADFPLDSFGPLPIISRSSEKILLTTTFFHLAQKFGQNLERSHLNRFLSGTLASKLRYCPYCLKDQEHPHYLLTWRFIHYYTCHKHQCTLLDYCGHCGSSIPICYLPPKLPYCMTCKKDLRQCKPRRIKIGEEQTPNFSYEDLSFLLSPDKCEAEENILLTLSKRLMYRSTLKSIRIVHSGSEYMRKKITPDREAIRFKEKRKYEKNIRAQRATLLNYLSMVDFLGVSFKELFDENFFSKASPDPDEILKRMCMRLGWIPSEDAQSIVNEFFPLENA